MTQNAATTNNVTNFTPPKDSLNQAIELLHVSQINSEYTYAGMALAGPLLTQVGRLFPAHMILIYMTTSYKRRQVWNAYIAKTYCDPANPQSITDPSTVRHKLMHTSSKELLTEAYGSIPDGFLSALKRLGTEGQEPQVYLLLHQFMSASSELRKAFSHASVIKASTVTTLAKLPNSLQSFELADQIVDPKDIKTLTFIINTLAQGDEEKYGEICSNVVKAAERKHSISSVLKREYHRVPFPNPVVCDSECCRYINSAADLEKAAIQFSNCLKDYVPEAHNSMQYYRWFENNRPVAAISLRNDHPFSWRIYEIKGKKNEYIDDVLEKKIARHFAKHEIYKMPSMEGLLNNISSAFKSDHRANGPTDHINDIIDGLLGDGEQI